MKKYDRKNVVATKIIYLSKIMYVQFPKLAFLEKYNKDWEMNIIKSFIIIFSILYIIKQVNHILIYC